MDFQELFSTNTAPGSGSQTLQWVLYRKSISFLSQMQIDTFDLLSKGEAGARLVARGRGINHIKRFGLIPRTNPSRNCIANAQSLLLPAPRESWILP